MRQFEADIYTDGGTRSFRVKFEAEDYFEAERRLIAQYGAGKFSYLTEVYR
ncbi:hypothetical protein [Limnohabitans sp. Jir72]|uniref:hypothetical protein n=1 Tax=Limnohabitans sp. Jir72 TaxID=1977909 RepID=UPI001304A9F1|nr:hypothetical protein [Limnohabitans sp. Jir72]